MLIPPHVAFPESVRFCSPPGGIFCCRRVIPPLHVQGRTINPLVEDGLWVDVQTSILANYLLLAGGVVRDQRGSPERVPRQPHHLPPRQQAPAQERRLDARGAGGRHPGEG